MSLVDYVKELIGLYKNRDLGYVPVSEQLLLEIAERIEFLEARQTELQEEGTKLITEGRELKAMIQELKEVIK